MAAEAKTRRDLTAAKLDEAVRQLRRYLDSGGKSRRVLENNCKKIEVEKEELLQDHYRYSEKSATPIEDESMKGYLNDKLDTAVDTLNEATDTLDELNETDVKENDELEAGAIKREFSIKGELLQSAIDEASKIILVEKSCVDDVIQAENILDELEKKEKSLEKCMSTLRRLISEEELGAFSQKDSTLNQLLNRTYSRVKLFIKKNSAPEKNSEKVPDKNSMQLEKVKPPTFSGDIRTFARFKADFEAIVKPVYKDELYLTYFLKATCLSGPAYELVRNLDSSDEIWGRLEERYGDTIDIVDSVVNDIQAVTINKFAQDRGVVHLVGVLEKGVLDLTAIGKRKEIANAYTVKLLEQKLPRRVLIKWLEEQDKTTETDRFEALFLFLRQERKRSEKLLQHSGEGERCISTKEKSKKREITAMTDYGIGNGQKMNNSCLIHPNSKHFTRKCKTFLSKSVSERDKLVKDLKGCRLCLSLSHVGSSCPWESKWSPCGVNGCEEYHSRLLHDNHYLKPSCKASCDGESGTLLLIQNAKGEKGDTIVFFDSGSTISLVRKDYADRCNLTGINVSYELITLGNVAKLQNTVLYDVPLLDRKGNRYVIKAYAIEEICRCENTDLCEVVCLFKNLRLKDVQRRRYKDVEVLIGMDYAHLHPEPIEKIENIILYSSRFGSGKVLGGKHKLINGVNGMNTFAKTVSHARSVKIEVIKPRTEVDFFTSEGLGVNIPPKCKRCRSCKDCSFQVNQLSRCEQQELEVIKANLQLDRNQKKWITTYPYKIDPATLSNNRNQIETLLIRTEKRLMRDDNVKETYCRQFQDFIDRGIFREIPDEEMNLYSGPVFYISHHEVYKSGSTSTPVRIVSNSSLKNKDGVSLNDVLMKGPNSLNNLFAVQLRFRTYTVALVGDISKMYNAIVTTEKERHLRRLLWRELDVNVKPRTYGVETVMFGDKPAAAVSATAISQTAEMFKYIDEVAASKIKNDIYVDDITTGAENVDDANKLKENMTKILAEGGFHVKGFVMSGDTKEESIALLGTGEVGRILGIGWIPFEDRFVVNVKINISKKFKGARKDADLDDQTISKLANRKLTRRMLLSITNSCYDPLGMVCPITVQLKIELRKLYSKELGLSWDEDIPEEIKITWVKLVKLLKSVEGIKSRRCVHEPDSRKDPELVLFCDGSPLAMCSVAYVRWELPDGTFSTFLFAAKTRVTPLERVTIPRIEMQSAVIAVRLGNCIVKHSGYNFRNIYYMSDPTCTLATIKKDSVALKEYMGNRVAEINEYSSPSQWYHVMSNDNIADIGTRLKATVRDLGEESDWQRGPAWLRRDKKDWPVSQELSGMNIVEDDTQRAEICFFNEKEETLLDMEKYCSFNFLMKVTARIFMIYEQKTLGIKELSLLSYKKAEMYWLKQSMKYTKVELEKGNLLSLRPLVDKDGTIILGSRAIEGMKHHYNAESFPILTLKDPLAALWMRDIHNEDHTGVTKTVAKSRRKFWIVRARKLAEKIKRECYKCRLLDKKLESQQMAPLPQFRTTISPVFNVTSLDLFGPFMVRDMVKKRAKMKIWGLILTCAATRAIYLDLVDGYSTDAFLQTLRKFVSIRGCPSKFISDPGSQLLSVTEDTKDSKNGWNNIKSWAVSNEIEWEFIPADSQHFNGLSESMVKSVKRSIKHVIGENVLSFSEFQLMFFEIANIINSRPIGIVGGADADSPTHITPNDLILGRSTNKVPHGPFETKASITKRFLFVQRLIDEWWKSWFTSVLPSLVPSYKWLNKSRNIRLGDICLISYKGGIRATYRLGRVIGVHNGVDGMVRKIKLEYRLNNEKVFRTVERSIHGVAVIVPIEEQNG